MAIIMQNEELKGVSADYNAIGRNNCSSERINVFITIGLLFATVYNVWKRSFPTILNFEFIILNSQAH